MDAIKALLSIILCIVLLAAEIITMGLFSLDKALSEDVMGENIKETMEEMGISGQLAREALAQSEFSTEGHYGEVAQAVLETDAMTDFFAGYLTGVVNEQVYEEPAEEVTEEQLLEVFTQGIEEVDASGQYFINDEEKEALTQAIQAEAPALMEKVSKQAESYEAVLTELTEESMGEGIGVLHQVRTFMDAKTRMMAMGGCLLILLIVIALNWKSRFGFLWCAVVTAIVATLYWGLSYIGAEKIISYMLHSSYLQETALSMITAGLKSSAVSGTIAAVIFIVIFAVFKMADRRSHG